MVEVGNNSALIVDDPQGIFGQQLRPHLIPLLNIIFIIVSYKIIKNHLIIKIIFKLTTGNYKGRNRSVSANKARKRINTDLEISKNFQCLLVIFV